MIIFGRIRAELWKVADLYNLAGYKPSAAEVAAIKERKEKYIFFYNVERIKKYKYACMHHYEKNGDHYETAEKYKADTYWGDPANYSQVIY